MWDEGTTTSLPNEGGGHTKVGRPAHMNSGALESALRMATINTNAEMHL